MRMNTVKYSTAIRHLSEMTAAASDRLRLRETGIGWPLEELWVAGELLDGPDTLEAGSVVLILDVPPDELPWLALHPAGEWVGEQLRLGKRPMHWFYRPLLLPAWNHEHQRLVRFWSAAEGPHEDVLAALRERRLDRLPVTEPSEAEVREQLERDLEVSRRHLREILDRYWDFDWRRQHKRFDETPDDHLWRAARAVLTMLDVLG